MTHNHGDFLEWLHHFLYFFIRGNTYSNQYAGTVYLDEEELEKVVFHPHGVSYNPLSYWKRIRDRNSVGSWRLIHQSHPTYIEVGMQLHWTLYRNPDNSEYIDIYAHYEKDWSSDPLGHLREINFSAKKGVELTRRFFRDDTFVDLHYD